MHDEVEHHENLRYLRKKDTTINTFLPISQCKLREQIIP